MAAGELGVKDRRERDVAGETEAATTSAVLETPVKRRKLEEEVDVESRIILSPCVQATNRGGTVARNLAGASETSVVIVRRRDSPVEYDLDRTSVSCCSEEKSKRRIEFVDAEEDNCSDQTVTSWIYDNFSTRRDPYSEQQEESIVMDSAAKKSNHRLKLQKMNRETVKESEVEDFFQTAEKDLRMKTLEFSRKYNFDFEKDEPLGGRCEWVKLSP